jgi:hypothetical protein
MSGWAPDARVTASDHGFPPRAWPLPARFVVVATVVALPRADAERPRVVVVVAVVFERPGADPDRPGDVAVGVVVCPGAEPERPRGALVRGALARVAFEAAAGRAGTRSAGAAFRGRSVGGNGGGPAVGRRTLPNGRWSAGPTPSPPRITIENHTRKKSATARPTQRIPRSRRPLASSSTRRGGSRFVMCGAIFRPPVASSVAGRESAAGPLAPTSGLRTDCRRAGVTSDPA